MTEKYRIEKDLLGELKVPKNAYWGINTQRALLNFQISSKRFPKVFLTALAKIKFACLLANQKLKNIDEDLAKAIKKHGGNVTQAAEELGLTRTSLYRRMEKHGI